MSSQSCLLAQSFGGYIRLVAFLDSAAQALIQFLSQVLEGLDASLKEGELLHDTLLLLCEPCKPFGLRRGSLGARIYL